MKSKGVVHLIPLFIIALVAGLLVYFKKDDLISNLSSLSFLVSTSTPQPSVSPTPSIEASPSPSLSPSSSPTVKPTTSPSPRPTQTPVSGPPGAGLSTITVQTEKGAFRATVLSIDLNSARVITDTANDSDCGDNCPVLSLQDFVNKNGGFAGVNGTYFCPDTYPDCASKKNSFDFPVYNTRLSKWINAGNLFWDHRAMVWFDGNGAHYVQNANSYSGGPTAGIANFPGLLSGSNVQIDEAQSGLSSNQRARGTKVGIGTRGARNVMVVVAQSVNMYEFAHVFKSLGADGALNLDTGGSTALYNGGYVFGPGRNLPNAIIFAR